MFYNFEIDGKEYELKLTTKNTIALEKKIGKSPLSIFGRGETIPTVDEMVNILHYSLLAYNHSITFDKSMDLFDKWLEEGHTITDFIPVILEIYKVSGIIAVDDDNEKN